MKKNEFAILHELNSGQFLVNTEYEHGEQDPFKLTIKFWSKSMNGFASTTMSWPDDKGKDFKKAFDDLKNIENAQNFFDRLSNAF